MTIRKKIISLSLCIYPLVSWASASDTAKRLELVAGNKASIQWQRVFKSARKMKRYHIDTLSKNEQEELKEYLISHAADSDQPTIAGM